MVDTRGRDYNCGSPLYTEFGWPENLEEMCILCCNVHIPWSSILAGWSLLQLSQRLVAFKRPSLLQLQHAADFRGARWRSGVIIWMLECYDYLLIYLCNIWMNDIYIYIYYMYTNMKKHVHPKCFFFSTFMSPWLGGRWPWSSQHVAGAMLWGGTEVGAKDPPWTASTCTEDWKKNLYVIYDNLYDNVCIHIYVYYIYIHIKCI